MSASKFDSQSLELVNVVPTTCCSDTLVYWGVFDVETVVIIGGSSVHTGSKRSNAYRRNLSFYRSLDHRRYGGFDIQLLSRQAQKVGTNKGKEAPTISFGKELVYGTGG